MASIAKREQTEMEQEIDAYQHQYAKGRVVVFDRPREPIGAEKTDSQHCA
jgi:hypothetical protein